MMNLDELHILNKKEKWMGIDYHIVSMELVLNYNLVSMDTVLNYHTISPGTSKARL
jgi:hypothetical protein